MAACFDEELWGRLLALSSWLLLGNMIHFCLLWFSGNPHLTAKKYVFAPLPTSAKSWLKVSLQSQALPPSNQKRWLAFPTARWALQSVSNFPKRKPKGYLFCVCGSSRPLPAWLLNISPFLCEMVPLEFHLLRPTSDSD